MKRRAFLHACCLACFGSVAGAALADDDSWQPPPRFTRPDISTDEGDLWAAMDRAEARLRRSPFLLRNPKLQARVEEIACRLGGDHCADIRVYLVQAPYFNANMAPNGMMQVWSGLMLRVDNEAQLAAVLGHEIAHYLERHGIERLRYAKSRGLMAQLANVFGLGTGTVALAAAVGATFAYSREQESDADRIGALLMHRAGYDAAEAPKIWANLLLEIKAHGTASNTSPFFATHPATEERQAALGGLTQRYAGGRTNEAAWQESISPFLHEWLHDELKRGQHEESLAFLARAVDRRTDRAEYLYARGQVHHQRGAPGDAEAALADFRAAVAAGHEPPGTHRALGMIYRARKQPSEAQESFEHYLKLAPAAPDAPMIRSYLEELRT